MREDDLIQVPGYPPGTFARRALADALVVAGNPRLNSLTRLYAEQKYFWDEYQAGRGAGADNPDDESQPLAHLRGVAADIDSTPARVRALTAAGLVRPYSWEPWHWQLPGDVRRFDIIYNLPAPTTPKEDDDMLMLEITAGNAKHRCSLAPGVFRHFIPSDPAEHIKNLARFDDQWQPVDLKDLPALLRTYGCDLHIWDIRDGQFVVFDPLTGTVKSGNMWSAANAARAVGERIMVTSEQTRKYVETLAA